MREFIWRIVARIVTIPAVTSWLIARALPTPYTHITSSNGREVYMGRWWLFNPYPPASDGGGRRWADWLPSIRIHHIMREDRDRHLHDHPWNARTIILRGWYEEERPMTEDCELRYRARRNAGYTGRLLFGQYHRIRKVSPGGVLTLFITWRKRGTWGFFVNGNKVPWRKYLGVDT
jgi:hypothetical protein